MKEHALPQRQEQNAARDIEAQSTSRERNHTSQMESPVLLAQLFEDGSGIQDGPGSDWDFSIIPAHTNINDEKGTLPETPAMVSQPAGNEAESISGPTCRVDETVERVPGNTSVIDKGESIAEHTEDSNHERPAPVETTGPALLVEDSVTRLDRGQMKKSEFLDRLQVEVTETVAAALVGTGRTTEDCPYLSYWFDFYMHQDSKHIERAIHKYAPESLGASRAAAYIASITQRARQSAQIWVMTGKITGVPEGVPLDGNGMSAANGQVLFKARQGGVRGTHDPQTIQQELGAGRPLDMGVRSRMEPVFNMDFSHVRTHTDEKASILSTRYNARAFTVGEHIAFGSGEYLPGTLTGDSLIAHELAHVAQQRGASLNEAPAAGYNNAGHSALEADADWVATGIMTTLWNGFGAKQQGQITGTAPRLRSGLQLQRCAARQRPTAATTNPDRTLSILAMPQTPPPELLLPGGPAAAGPLHLPFGQYQEYIGWNTLNRNGFIVQEMDITHNATDCSTGTPDTFRPTPHYYEAWEVDGRGRSTPGLGGVNDMWVRTSFPNTEGNWSYRGRVYWVNELDPNAHFARGNVTEAGPILFSTTTPPNNLGPALLGRRAGGSWDCTGTHTPA